MVTKLFEELQKQLESTSNAIQRIELMNKMGMEARNYNPEQAETFANSIIEASNEIGYILGLGKGYNLKGSILAQYGEYDEARALLEKAFEIALKEKDLKLQARVRNNLGLINRDQGDLGGALEQYEKALAINKDSGDQALQSNNLLNIAVLWYDLGEYDNALDYALQCIKLIDESEINNRLLNVYVALGDIYFKKDMQDEAASYYQRASNNAQHGTNYYLMAKAGLGKVAYKTKAFDVAIDILEEISAEAAEIENVEVQIICKFYLGKIHLEEESYRTARRNFLAAYELAKDYSRRHDMMSLHEVMSELYEKMGDIPKAYQHIKSFEKLKEEIFHQTTFNKLRNLQVQQEIELAKKEKEVAETTAKLKQQFMANMSHEIRTPMNAIVGLTRLLIEQDPRPDQLRYLKAIQQSSDSLLVIINDILDLSKIEAGKVVIERTNFDVIELTKNIGDILNVKAVEKGLSLNVDVSPTVPQWVMGDPTRLNQVLVNLIGNAIKFTEKGFVKCILNAEKTDDTLYKLTFDIVDTGIGISKEYVDKIFESFTQAGTDTARKFGGTGLGLTISKQLTDLMGGHIKVKSTLGLGTTFTVELPMEVATEVLSTTDKVYDEAAMKAELKGLKVLLVEDNAFNKMVAEDTLKSAIEDLDLDVAENGLEAIEKVKSTTYDAVLMDIQMPVMNGIEATKFIRKELPMPQKDICIIAMTANVLDDNVKQYAEIGMNGYVSKPFNKVDLLQALINAKHKTGQIEMAAPTASQKLNINIPDNVTNLDFLKSMSNGDATKLQKYIDMFLDNAPRLLNRIDEGIAQKDFEAVKIAAHSLKPQLGYMGVQEEVSQVFMLEQTAGEKAHFDKIPPLFEHLKEVCKKAFEELKHLQ